jgi:hypothetical protein
MADRRALQAASATLGRFSNDFRTSRKGDGWSPREIINQHRDALAQVCEEIGPILEARLVAEVALDRAEKAEAFAYNGPGQLPPAQRIGEGGLRTSDTAQATAAVDAVARQRAELAAIEEETRLAVVLAPDAERARQAVGKILARISIKNILRGGGQ